MIKTRAELKSVFETGDIPTQVDFENFFDSFVHQSEKFSGAYADLSGKPTLFSGAWADLIGKPSVFAPSAHTHLWADLTDKPTTFAPAAHVHSAGEITTGLFHPSRIGAGTTTDGYMIQMVSGVPTWVIAPSGGIGWSLSGSATSGTDKLGSTNTYVNLLANGSDYGQFGAATGSLRIGNATQGTAQSRNTIVGDFGGGGGMGGSDNAVFGRLALYQSSGIGHSAFGQGAGYCITPITGNYLSFFGFETQALSAGLSNSTAIGANAQIAESNTVVLGNPACGTIVGGNTIHSSLKFVVESTTKAARLPIMSKTQMNAIPTPTKGAELYLNDDNGKMWYDGTRWTGFRYNGTKFQGYDGTSWLDLN